MPIAPGDPFAPFAALMRAHGQPELALQSFARHYADLRGPGTGYLRDADLTPVASLPDADDLADYAERGAAALAHAVVIKLNGGLGTGMGMSTAKSLLAVKDGLSFLDLIALQVLDLRARHDAPLPILFMNSFRTRDDTLAALARYPELAVAGLPLDFLQHQVPKVRADDLTPATHPTDPELAWCPPGHGDLYLALHTSGLLANLLARGVRWAFVSNADNLGAVVSPALLGYLAAHDLPFLMEVTDRTEADKKGGHLALSADGRLRLRESGQCHPDDATHFQDWHRHRYFNTNNLWVDLVALASLLDLQGGALALPLIRNAKPLDPSDPTSPAVYQLETAMGAALEVFAGAAAVRVPRTRFAPVKTTSDLLALWSDAYVRTPDHRIELAPSRAALGPPLVDLDPRFFAHIGDLEARFPHGAPSLCGCRRLAVRGDVRFGARVRVVGDALVERDGQVGQDGQNPAQIPDDAVLGG